MISQAHISNANKIKCNLTSSLFLSPCSRHEIWAEVALFHNINCIPSSKMRGTSCGCTGCTKPWRGWILTCLFDDARCKKQAAAHAPCRKVKRRAEAHRDAPGGQPILALVTPSSPDNDDDLYVDRLCRRLGCDASMVLGVVIQFFIIVESLMMMVETCNGGTSATLLATFLSRLM